VIVCFASIDALDEGPKAYQVGYAPSAGTILCDGMSAHTSCGRRVIIESLATSMPLTDREKSQVACASCAEARECNNPRPHRRADEELKKRVTLGASLEFLEQGND